MSSQLGVENRDLLYIEQRDCFRIKPPNLLRSGYNNNRAQVNSNKFKHYVPRWECDSKLFNVRGDRYKPNSSLGINYSVPMWKNKYFFDAPNKVRWNAENRSYTEYVRVTNGCRTINNLLSRYLKQPDAVKLETKSEETVQYQNEFNLGEKDQPKVNQKNVDRNFHSNESEEAYKEFLSEITEALQQKYGVTIETQKIKDPKKNGGSEGTLDEIGKSQKLSTRKSLQSTEKIKHVEINRGSQGEQNKKRPRLPVSQSNIRPRLPESQPPPTHKNRTLDNHKDDWRVRRKHDVKSNYQDMESGSNGGLNKGVRTGIQPLNRYIPAVNTQNEISSTINTQYPTFTPVYQYWVTNLPVNYPTPSQPVPTYNWWPTTTLTYPNFPSSLTQPYTGVAGHNWPTVRKPPKREEPEEKTNFPVYVKPPVVGSEETEQLRNAFFKYVKWLRYKLHHQMKRKRKQMIRRERNHKLKLEKLAKIGRTYYLSAAPQEEILPSEESHCTPEQNDKLEVDEAISTEENNATIVEGDSAASSETASLNNYQNNLTDDESREDFKETERGLPSDLLNLTADVVEICDGDSIQEVSVDNNDNNEETEYYPRKERDRRPSPHPINGPVCYRKDDFVNAFDDSLFQEELNL